MEKGDVQPRPIRKASKKLLAAICDALRSQPHSLLAATFAHGRGALLIAWMTREFMRA